MFGRDILLTNADKSMMNTHSVFCNLTLWLLFECPCIFDV